MIFSSIVIDSKEPIYSQIKIQIVKMIDEGMLTNGSKLPSTRELSEVLTVSRNSCIRAYEILEDENYIVIIKGKGTFVSHKSNKDTGSCYLNWSNKINISALEAVNLDIIKSEPVMKKGMISFKSIAPDEKLFNLEQIRRDFLNILSFDGKKLLNYGYAKGYKPLIEFLSKYMSDKGLDLKNKEILITNGFTEAFDILLSTITTNTDSVICENPTHNTALKLMKLHNLNIIGIDIKEGSINTLMLKKALEEKEVKLVYLTPSYHNPTGTVMPASLRKEVYKLCKAHKVPIIEDGFNEELLYSSSHISPIAALAGEDNGVIYIGSFSKILFPGLRIGWIVADKKLIDILESVKRSRNIHTSVLDQAFLNEYLRSKDFTSYLRKARNFYRDKYNFTVSCAKKYIPNCSINGEGGLHIFLEIPKVDSRKLLEACIRKGVIFMPGHIFYVDEKVQNTLRIGFSKVSLKDIEKGLSIIGECVKEQLT